MKLKEKLLNTGYFIDNEWLDKYCGLIEDNKDIVKDKNTQKHHILQRAYYNLINQPCDDNKKNLVNLKYSDHILAHYYLCLCTKNQLEKSNRTALFFMLNTSPENFDEQQFIDSIGDYYNILYMKHKQDDSERNSGKNNPNYGLKRSIETKKKISQSLIGKNCKPVICLETLQIYDSCTHAAKVIGTNSASISACCIKEYYTVFDLHFRYYDETIDYSNIEIPKKVKARARAVKCIESGIIYDSIAEANRQTKVNKSSISSCCSGVYKTAGGYHWQYVE